jgi:hypothetical protein
MSNYIVIRIIPEKPVSASDFTNYLNPTSAGLGPLQITAYDLSFNSPTIGQRIGTAVFVAPTAAPSPTSAGPQGTPLGPAVFNPDPSSGIAQQYDLMPAANLESAFFQLQSVATAIIEVPAPTSVENLRLVAQWGSAPNATEIPVDQNYYELTLPTAKPNLNAWPSLTSADPIPDPWGAIPSPNLYLQIPAAPATTGATPLQLPSDGTPPFDALLAAVQGVLQSDPGSIVQAAATGAAAGGFTFQLASGTTGVGPGMSVSGAGIAPNAVVTSINSTGLVTIDKAITGAVTGVTIGPGVVATPTSAPAGGFTIQLPANTAVSAGMSVQGAGIPPGSTVVSIDQTGLVTLNQEIAGQVASVTFTPNLGGLSQDQCKNIAYEIVWSQQPPLPAPPEPVEDMYSSSSNSGAMLNSGNSPSPNQNEADRQQFEAQLKSYYVLADTTADRLTNFISALSTAIACERFSLAATSILLSFPVNPGSTSSPPLSSASVVLTGLPDPCGVPAGYFYALNAALPAQLTGQPQTWYAHIARSQLATLLAQLSAAINAGVISDSEAFVTVGLASVSAAQAARRIAALNVPAASSTALAPLDSFALLTQGTVSFGDKLTFASSVAAVTNTMTASGQYILGNSPLQSINGQANSVTLQTPVLNVVGGGDSVVFTPAYPAGLQPLLQAWLNFPPVVTPGPVSTTTYQPTDDATKFWPGVAAGGTTAIASQEAAAFLNLVLCALTQGFMLPPPFNVALGDEITNVTNKLLSSSTVAALAGVTAQTWTTFFTAHPTWLPTQSGNIPARIAAFLQQLQKFFAVASGGPASPFVLPTLTPSNAGDPVQFAPTSAIVIGMSVSGPTTIPAGAVVSGVVSTATSTSVSLTPPVTSGGVGQGIDITFKPIAGASARPSTFGTPSKDWLSACLTAYQGLITPASYAFGSGFDLPRLQGAATTVFPGDPAAQAWIVEALVTFDALYKIMQSVTLPAQVPASDAAAFTFSVIEALYARGFTSAARITELSSSDFQQALIGTIAYDMAAGGPGSIWTVASTIAPYQAPQPPTAGFRAVNPDGSLTNCIPPPCSSPLGPVAYLSEMLQLSESSTCESGIAAPILLKTHGATQPPNNILPFLSTASVLPGMLASGNNNIPAGTAVTGKTATTVTLSAGITGVVADQTSITFTAPTLGSVLAQRRGPIGNLAASCANLETQLPLIDIVNECLEYLGSTASPTCGVVYDTASDRLAGLALCRDEPCSDETRECLDPDGVFGALPEYSTPATPPGGVLHFAPTPAIRSGMWVSGPNIPAFAAVAPEGVRSTAMATSVTLTLPVSGVGVQTGNQITFSAAGSAPIVLQTIASTPGSVVGSVTPAVWNNVKLDFASCGLPYSQALDVSRTYLRHFGSCRFEEMRTFRKCITEFVLSPENEPAGFEDFLPRSPARVDIAIEYLGITPEEYTLLYARTPLPTCGGTGDRGGQDNGEVGRSAPPAVWQLYGFSSQGDGNSWIATVSQLPEFLARTCLSYCEFFELWKSGYVAFRNRDDRQGAGFPECEPCCPKAIILQFPDREGGAELSLLQLAVFVRLWRKLQESCCHAYSFAELRDICDVLHLFNGVSLNSDFIRQLAAFQILREQFGVDLRDPHDKPAAGSVDDARTHILALWVGPTASKWGWAVRDLCRKIGQYARRRQPCDHRSDEFLEMLASKLDALSALAGFDPASTTDNWHKLPTHTLRFAEVLAKIHQSKFRVSELLYLFTANTDFDGGELFPAQDDGEAVEHPLGLPDDERKVSLWRLRKELLAAAEGLESSDAAGHEAEEWDWRRAARFLQEKLGFASSDVVALALHFFPDEYARAGNQVNPASARFVHSLSTTTVTWGTSGPYQYDSTGGQLWIRLPLADHAVVAQLVQLQALGTNERTAVQDLYFQPRAMLALFGVLFPDFSDAARHLIGEPHEHERWNYFRRHVALCDRRIRLIATHLSRHVAAATGEECPAGEATALLILRDLLGNENKATSDWERNDGTPPNVTWTPPPNGGAFAALLGLVGTGLVAEYKLEDDTLVWREASATLSGFGEARDRANAPTPTVLPALNATLTPQQQPFASVRNGFLVKLDSGEVLGGVQGFDVVWAGALLIDQEGPYEFWAGAPTPGDEKPDWEAVEKCKWRVVLKRGTRSWVLLSHRWPGEEERGSASRPLRRGAYELTVEFAQAAPAFASADQVRRQHTGFEIKYSGRDSNDERRRIPQDRLFSILKNDTLAAGGVGAGSPAAGAYLSRLYSSSLRDIRRTYQCAFKALLFAHRLTLSGRATRDNESELSYMLAHKDKFAGASYFQTPSGYTRHAADFDFDFLPIVDAYYPPAVGQDHRVQPSSQRIQAMFDWFERRFDYVTARDDLHRRYDRQLWRLFEDASRTQPTDTAQLLDDIGIEPESRKLALGYYVAQDVPSYSVTSVDLEDDRWGVRIWLADRWISALECCFAVKKISVARPDLWASDDPGALVSGESQTGNANLLAFLVAGCLENSEPRRDDALRRLNDGLRKRGRDALLAYLCQNRVPSWPPGQFATSPRELSDLLLLDVEVGVCERASRIEEAITAATTFIQRARLRLEPDWVVTAEFARLWDREFLTFDAWRACKRRQLYKENWVEWSDLKQAQGVEAFRFLETRLRDSEVTVAAPGGAEWWPDDRLQANRTPDLLQRDEPARLQMLPAERGGLDLMGAPERAARPAWLACVPSDAQSSGPSTSGGGAAGKPIPLWIEAAIRLGTKFWRIAAANSPPAAAVFQRHEGRDAKDCVDCCEECGCSHPVVIDEFYFWLVPGDVYQPPTTPHPTGFTSSGDFQNGYQDDYYDSNTHESALWEDPTQLPQLLAWSPSPTVRLAWCRRHNGEFGQPRRTARGVQVDAPNGFDLQFLGRTGDSLTFSVVAPSGHSVIVPPGHLDTSPPGFRYDMAVDRAVVLPLVAAPPSPPKYLTTLPAYPYFLFFTPGEPLIPLSPFSPSLAIAAALRARCRFEAALAWYREVFDPLLRDCAWVDCATQDSDRTAPNEPGVRGACCDATDVTCDQARNRAVVLHYLETLVEWSDAVGHRDVSVEALQQARGILDVAEMILGKTPRVIRLQPPATASTVAAFRPDFAPLNPRLMELYACVRDRMDLVRSCESAHRLLDRPPARATTYLDAGHGRDGWRMGSARCEDEDAWCRPPSPYRFAFLIQKAQDLAARVAELGGALQTAFEKGDAEFLASLRAGQEHELLTLGLEASKDQWREADWQIEALQKTKAVSQSNLDYYTFLSNRNLIDQEIDYQDLTINSTVLRGVGDVMEAIGQGFHSAGNYQLGAAGFGGSPLVYSQLPPGDPLGFNFEGAARIMMSLADVAISTAGLELTEGGWQRRSEEWSHQIDDLLIELQQMERQILAAERRRGQQLHNLNSYQRQIEHSAEVQDFLRDKFTAPHLYLFLQKEAAGLYRRMYELALDTGRQAEHAFNRERGFSARRFLPECGWDNLHEGLMAGERLSVALRHMEKAYLDRNVREYEMTKSVSLRLHFPFEFLRLRTTGRCEIEIPEWMFDVDYAGHFMRRLRSVALTIPCVTGPFTGVHCRMTLLASKTRMDPRLSAPEHGCCCPPEPCCRECEGEDRLANEYRPCPDDPRIVSEYGATEAIATSSGRDDSGLFELNLHDERYLPFEYRGAVSRWRIELPRESNYFDFETLTDLIVRLGFTAREGGEDLRRAAAAAARGRLPGDGWRFFDLRQDFSDAWQQMRDLSGQYGRRETLRLRLERKMFPFLPDGPDIWVDRMAIVFGPDEHEDPDCPRFEGCPCPSPRHPAMRVVEFVGHDGDETSNRKVHCRAGDLWPGLYWGVFDTHIGPVGRRRRHAELDFRFCDGEGRLESAFLLCRYTTRLCDNSGHQTPQPAGNRLRRRQTQTPFDDDSSRGAR